MLFTHSVLHLSVVVKNKKVSVSMNVAIFVVKVVGC